MGAPVLFMTQTNSYKEYKSLTSPPKPRSPEFGAEVVVPGLEAVAVPDVLAPELHEQ